jgi:hypothetical protein
MRKCLSLPILVASLMAGELGCGSSERIPGESKLREPTRVEVFRVGSELASSTDKATIGGYPILATGKEQGSDFAARLLKILRSDGVTPNRKKCGLEPGVAYRIWSGDKALEVLVCFKCDVLWPHVVGEEGTLPHHEWKDFDPVRSELLALTKEAFPEDAEIQGLPAHRNEGG